MELFEQDKGASDIEQNQKKDNLVDVMSEHIDYEKTFTTIKLGQFVKGKIVHVDSNEVLVDISYKSEGIIPVEELSFKKFSLPSEIVKVGDEINVKVIKLENREGYPVLSKKMADLESDWNTVLLAYEEGRLVKGTVVEKVRGGLIVNLGVRGFLPASQADINPVWDLNDMLGEELTFKIIEIDPDKRKVILSRRQLLLEEQAAKREMLWKNIYDGALVKGRVTKIANFGAFVDLGGLDGLIHISELSYRRIRHPGEVVKIGDEAEVVVLKFDRVKERISLSLKQATPSPWLHIDEKLQEGMVIEGTVTKLASKYAFVEISDGVEGLIPVAELSDERIASPEEVLKAGQKVKVKILSIKPDLRRVTLSLRQADLELQKAEYREYLNKGESSFTLGDLIKSKQKKSDCIQDVESETVHKKN